MKKRISPAQTKAFLESLEIRFEEHRDRHPKIAWAGVRSRLEASPGELRSLHEMERSGGEPDVVSRDRKTGSVRFVDCSAETPRGRTSVCYDRAGLESRREHRPETSATDLAAAMGIELLTEGEYLQLQELGDFDTRTSSWLKTPVEFRSLGGALYGERRYGRVFIGHNGAQSYYAVRGFRGSLEV